MNTFLAFPRTENGTVGLINSLKRLTPAESGQVWLVFDNPALEAFASELTESYLNIKTYYLEDKSWLKDELPNTPIVYVQENIWLDPGTVDKLLKDLRTKLDAGFVSAKFTEFPLKYKVDNIYEPTQAFELDSKGIIPIDIAFPYLFVCRREVFNELDFAADKVYFGLGLRRLGYQNYLDTSIMVGYKHE